MYGVGLGPYRCQHTTSTDRWTLKWSLIVTADMVRGRNTRRRRKVDILLAESATPQARKASVSSLSHSFD